MNDSVPSGKRAAYARYATLLSLSRLSGRESLELPAVIAELSLSSDQVDADRKLAERVSQLSREYGGHGAAAQELSRLRRLEDELKRRHQHEADEQARAITAAATRVESCNAAVVELQGLKAARPELFDAVAFPPRLWA